MAEVSLGVEKRETVGKKANKQLRREGKIPGIYYFHGEDSVSLVVNEKELKSVIHSESSIVDLNFDDKKKVKCVIREVQWDPVDSYPLHVDFMGIKLTEIVHVEVPVHLVGTPIGVKQEGGILQHIIRELSIESLPLDIPEHIDIDITDLDIGDGVRVEDISIEKVKILNEPTQSIVVIRPPVIEVEPEPEEVEGELEEEGAEPEADDAKKEDEKAQEEESKK